MVCSWTSYIRSDGSYQNRLHCNRIIVEDHTTGKHHFAIRKCVKEDGISDLLKKLYAADCILGGMDFLKIGEKEGGIQFSFLIRGGIKNIYETFSISLKETQTFKAY